MKRIFIVCLMHLFVHCAFAQYVFEGRVVSTEGGSPVPDVYVSLATRQILAITDTSGAFRFTGREESITVTFSKIGLVSKEVRLVSTSGPTVVRMEESDIVLQEVTVSTGYQTLPKERATGSFTHIDNELLNRSVSTDIVSRLEGVVGSLQFDRRYLNNSNNGRDTRDLRLRGVGTMRASSEPLIILDHFPFEGNINSINPNDIESVTVLKDAAAASIWGAKAGNGVIVITTKNGKYNSSSSLSFSANLTIQPKPDLYYSDSFLESPAFIEAEKFLYDLKFYQNDINDPNRRALTPAVELWNQYDKGLITRERLDSELAVFRNTDLRQEAEKHLYQNTVNAQYSLRSTGGGQNYKYFISGGYDKNLEEIKGNSYERYSVNFSNHFKPLKFLELNAGLAYTRSNQDRNGIGLYEIRGKRYPYAALQDEAGNSLSIPLNHSLSFAQNAAAEGLLNWEYKPLDDINQVSNTTSVSEIRLNLGARIDIHKDLAIDLKYYTQRSTRRIQDLSLKDSYKVRDLVNRYTQGNMTRIFPYNDILRIVNQDAISNSFRGQVSYNRHFDQSRVNFISGVELREYINSTNGFEQYGYDKDILTYSNMIDYATVYPLRPLGSARVPVPQFATEKLTDRFFSSYANSSYDFKGKYIVSGSLRWDASNLLGVKTNQKGVPLWSAGVLWKMKNEAFIKSDKVDRLDFRATIGQSGNLNRSASALPIASYLTDQLTGLRRAVVRNPGNPQLRWEKVATMNMGVDFSVFNRRIEGSVEYYIKSSSDLLGSPSVDPTVGHRTEETFMTYLVNYAGLRSNGIDFEINTLNTLGTVKWETAWLTGYVKNKVTRYEQARVSSVLPYTNNVSSFPLVGKPMDAMFSIPWNGLNSQNGDPLVYIEGKPSDNFPVYFNSLTLDDLSYSGLNFPPLFGSIRNTLSYKELSLSINLMWKAGYVFRRNSIYYYDLYTAGRGHSDFSSRWVKPGDELHTNVPSMPAGSNYHRDYVYIYSDALVEKGDHIRLQDINISYDVRKKQKSLKVFLYANNLGIIWKKTRSTMDPDYPNAMLAPNKSVSVGLKIDLH